MLCRICLFVLALMSYGGQTQNCPSCPTEFHHFPDELKCYKVFDVPLTWYQAFQKCNELGAHLAVVKYAEANAVLRTAITPFKDQCLNPNGTPCFWTAGARYCSGCSSFKWYSGLGNLLDMGYTNWNESQPDNSSGNENCIEIGDHGNMEWNDVRCAKYRCFICEIDI